MGISYTMTELFPFQNNHIYIKVCQCVLLVKLQMVTAAMKLKDGLLLGRTAMTNPDSILKSRKNKIKINKIKSRDITLLTKVHLVKAMVFPVVIYRCESWTIKKAEHQRIDT